MTRSHKTVLMAHLDREQGQVWKLALETQKFQVTNTKADIDLATLLNAMVQNQELLPDLILIDIGLKSKPADRFAESPQAETLCRWIWKVQAATKVVVFNPQVNKISDLAHRWGIRRGADAVLPRLDRENLIASIQKITDILACEFLAEPLQSVVVLLPPQISDLVQTDELPSFPPPNPNQPNDGDIEESDSPEQESVVAPPNALDTDETVVVYRGAKIRESQMSNIARIEDKQPVPPQLPQTKGEDYELVYRGARIKKRG